MEKLYRKGEIRMSLHYGNHGGGGNCGCCCSYQAESYNTANQYGRTMMQPVEIVAQVALMGIRQT